jgi:DNA repair protein RadC
MNQLLTEISDNEIAEEFVSRFQRKVGERLQKSITVANHLRAVLSAYVDDVEHFMCIFLDSQLRIITTEVVANGTLASSAVYPREIIKKVLQHEAAHVILGHNHPSGETIPSSSDRAITKKLVAALASLDIDVLDHVILGNGFFSFSDEGLL